MPRPCALTIAGSDPSGGAGLQADLKTFQAHGVYGMSVVTLLTVQNTRGVFRVETLSPALVREQLGAVLGDLPPASIKIGALGSAGVAEAIRDGLQGRSAPLVIDPVMISTAGTPLLDDDAERFLRMLFEGADLVTPNAPEAEALTGRSVASMEEALNAAKAIRDLGAKAVLIKGGHLEGAAACDLLLDSSGPRMFSAPRLPTKHTHGTGCTLASAICARLGLGHELAGAVEGAKLWLQRAIAGAPHIGDGRGPLDHFAATESTFVGGNGDCTLRDAPKTESR